MVSEIGNDNDYLGENLHSNGTLTKIPGASILRVFEKMAVGIKFKPRLLQTLILTELKQTIFGLG